MAQDVLEILLIANNKATKPINDVIGNIDDLIAKQNAASRATNKLQKALLGVGLSALFSGMALSRATGSALKSILNTSKMVGSELTVFNIKTQELTASWEFFKYTFIDALSHSELFLWLIDGVISLINWFSQLPESVRLIILVGLAIGFVTGKIASLVGQIALAYLGLTVAFGSSVASAILTIGLYIGLILIALTLLYLIWTNPKWSFFTKMILSTVIVFTALLIVLGLIPALVGAIIAIFVFMSVKWGGVINFLKSALGGLVIVLAYLGDSIINYVLEPINLAILALNTLIRAINKFTKSNIPLISSVSSESLLGGQSLQARTESAIFNSEFFKSAVNKGEEINASGGLFSVKDSVDKNGSDTNSRLDKIISLLSSSQASFTPAQ